MDLPDWLITWFNLTHRHRHRHRHWVCSVSVYLGSSDRRRRIRFGRNSSAMCSSYDQMSDTYVTFARWLNLDGCSGVLCALLTRFSMGLSRSSSKVSKTSEPVYLKPVNQSILNQWTSLYPEPVYHKPVNQSILNQWTVSMLMECSISIWRFYWIKSNNDVLLRTHIMCF